MTGTVKRSLSTPNVLQATVSMVDASSPSQSADKRRNKLGYHRTSVACGHCRRRKIRCLLAKDDARGRCSNCIRLKKECNFYPVDSGDRRPRSLSKTEGHGNHDPASVNSSPSPGHGEPMHLQFTAMEDTRGYPASVPVTPTCEYQSAFDDGFCKNSFSGSKKRGRTPGVRSTDVSRRPSLAQMHVMPLTMKVESGLLRPAENFRGHRWEIPSQAEAPMPPTTAPGLSTPAFADPSSAFWRLEGQDMGAGPYITPQPSIDNFRPFNSFDAPTEIPDEQWRSQVSSRVGSIDQGAGTGYSFGAAYSPETEFAPPPDLCSASTSTASLVASVSEVSVYGGDPRPVGQFYMNQWATQSQPAYPSGMPLKPELYDDPTSMYHTTGEAGFTNPRDATFVFQTPNHSPTPANMPGP